MKIQTKKLIDVSEWDNLVMKTYGRPYSLQQQDGGQPRGLLRFTVPDDAEDFRNDSVLEMINGTERGVNFAAWKARDPKEPVKGDLSDPRYTFLYEIYKYPRTDDWEIAMFWERNFYPDFQTVANDLHAKGKLEAGEYAIDID